MWNPALDGKTWPDQSGLLATVSPGRDKLLQLPLAPYLSKSPFWKDFPVDSFFLSSLFPHRAFKLKDWKTVPPLGVLPTYFLALGLPCDSFSG